MTTPQHELYTISRNVQQLSEMLMGECLDEDEYKGNIYEICTDIKSAYVSLENKMQLIEDKMNLIIKLLSKE